ncbi:hypothetical protein TNCV_3737951 [Trichonephila clavipes]|nr:hypothetical protein TNCV_3737951 [Trichonephila clavipes]
MAREPMVRHPWARRLILDADSLEDDIDRRIFTLKNRDNSRIVVHTLQSTNQYFAELNMLIFFLGLNSYCISYRQSNAGLSIARLGPGKAQISCTYRTQEPLRGSTSAKGGDVDILPSKLRRSLNRQNMKSGIVYNASAPRAANWGESLFTLPSNQSESRHLALSQSKKLFKTYHPDKAQKQRLPDPIIQPIAVMPPSRTKNPTFAMPLIEDLSRNGIEDCFYSPEAQKSNTYSTPI